MRQIGRKCFIGLIVMCLSFSLVWAPVANAQAGIAAGRLSVAISEITIAKAARWGFAANDPRVTATRAGISGGLTVLAAGAGLVTWPALLVAAGVGALVAGAIALSKDGKYTWLFGNGSITSGGSTATSYDVAAIRAQESHGSGPMTSTSTAYGINVKVYDRVAQVYVDSQIAGSNAEQVAASWAGYYYGPSAYISGCSDISSGVQCGGGHAFGGFTVYLLAYPNGSFGKTSATGFYDSRPPAGDTLISAVVYSKADDAIAAIPATVAAQTVSPELLAASANAAWKSATPASTTGGLPWSASDPITPDEVSTWMGANPNSVPTVANFASAGTVSVGGQVTVPVGDTYSMGGGSSASLPSTSSGSGSSTTPSTGTANTPATTTPTTTAPSTTADPNAIQVNLGPIPNIGAPTLEDTPDASKILDPAFSLMPDLKSFSVPAHAGVCPTASFALYGKNYVMDAHCGLLEQNRTLIGALMVLVFTLVATYTVLRA